MKQKQFINEVLDVVQRHKPNPQQFRYAIKKVRAAAKLGLPKRPGKIPKFYSPAEMYSILDAGRKESPAHGLLVEALLQTGLRISEMHDLDLRDLDPHNNVMHVREGKGGKDRTVPLTSRLYNQIRTFCRQPNGEPRRTGPVFLLQNHHPVSVRTLQHWYATAAKKAGIVDPGKTGPHAARHTFACLCINRGMRLEDVQVMLGHSSRKTTEIYAKIAFNPEMKARMLQLFESGL